MINFFEDFFYFNNKINYFGNLSKKDNKKDFNEIILYQKKNAFIQLCTIFISLSIIIFLELIFLYHESFKINFLLIIIIIFIIFNIFAKILIINSFSNSYTYFIQLCEVIVQYENKIKSKIKIKYMLKTDEEESEPTSVKIIEAVKNIVMDSECNNDCNINNKNKKGINFYFNEYQNQKQKLFKYIFLAYQKEYIIKKLYIIKFIQILFNYSRYLNYNLNFLINIFKESLQILNIEEINFESLFKNYEKYIYNHYINTKEKEINELNTSVLNLFESNYKLNEYYMNLIKEINSENNKKKEKINEIIEYIKEKNNLYILLLEQIKKKINKENEIINENTQNNIISNIIKGNTSNNNEISLSDIQLNNYSHESQNKNFEDNIKENKGKSNINKKYDIINEQKKMEIIKSDFIEELNKYCKSKQNLNKTELESNNDNKRIEEKNKLYNINTNISNSDINKIKFDFAKSLTESLKKNKNFNFNSTEEHK